MKNWQITAKEKIETGSGSENLTEGHSKVRITRTDICDTDILQYKVLQKEYPIIPCRHAAGVISEIGPNDLGLDKGDDVVLDPYIPCNDCIFCKNEDYANCQNMKIYGKGKAGFLRDFAVLPLANIKKLPENVKTEDAVFVEYIAIALKIIDDIRVHKGEHVIICGAGVLGNIIAQLVMYYQAIPVLIDSNPQNLERAKSSEIYYTLSADDKDLDKKINEITGGRLAKYAVYISGVNISINNILKYIRSGGILGITGFLIEGLGADLKDALEKQLTIICINNGYGNIDSAINMLATKNVDLSTVQSIIFKFSEADKAFEILSKESDIYHAVIDCIADD